MWSTSTPRSAPRAGPPPRCSRCSMACYPRKESPCPQEPDPPRTMAAVKTYAEAHTGDPPVPERARTVCSYTPAEPTTWRVTAWSAPGVLRRRRRGQIACCGRRGGAVCTYLLFQPPVCAAVGRALVVPAERLWPDVGEDPADEVATLG